MNKIKLDPHTTPGHLLIAEERMEQFTRHGFSLEKDRRWNKQELLKASMFCITLKDDHWPIEMGIEVRDHIKNKTRNERLAIAGAFIAADMDRARNLQQAPFITLW